MSGVEVIIGVCGAVSALITVFKHAHSLYRDWEAAKRSERLDKSLTIGQRQLQEEYNAYFLRLGARFASGDDIAVSELKDIIIILQSLIMVLQSSAQSENRGAIRWFGLPGNNRRQGSVTTDTSRLVEISDNARVDSIKVMTELSQRLAPIPRSVSEPTPSFTAHLTAKLRVRALLRLCSHNCDIIRAFVKGRGAAEMSSGYPPPRLSVPPPRVPSMTYGPPLRDIAPYAAPYAPPMRQSRRWVRAPDGLFYPNYVDSTSTSTESSNEIKSPVTYWE